eukprot:COSAG04_NODE_201_length_20457_cov_316.186462_10_plen_68_part_00
MAKKRAKMGEIWPKKKSAGRRSIIEATVLRPLPHPKRQVRRCLVPVRLGERIADDRFGDDLAVQNSV